MKVHNQMKTGTDTAVRVRRDCRMCDSTSLTKVWSFGKTPLANNYLAQKDLAQKKDELLVPLEVYKCENCHLIQLRHVVDPAILFGNYLYVSSTSPVFIRHFEEYAKTIHKRFKLSASDTVIDIGSNDGILLKPFKTGGVRVLGIEPAKNIAQQATKEGIETLPDFFTPQLGNRIRKKYGSIKVITANNVFAHTDNVDEFVATAKELLTPDGIFVFEAQYLGDLLAKNLFDIVYHEHLCYYHIHPLIRFFGKHGMQVFDVERSDVHGGSVRVYVQLQEGPYNREKRLNDILAEEEKNGLNTLLPYQDFAKRIQNNKRQLHKIIKNIKEQKKRIAGFGAPAKATTFCYVNGIDGTILDYIVDDSELKQQRYMPGTHIPIVPANHLYSDQPDYCLILAWNFAEPIMKTHQVFFQKGGKWIVPMPEPHLV